MDVLLSLLWLVGIIAGIVFIFKPNPKWAVVANRKRAALSLAAVFFGIPILLAIISPSSGSKPATASAPAKPLTPEEQKAKDAADAEAKRQEELAEAREHPERFLALTNESASKGGFDTVMILSGTIKNSGPITIKDPKIKCHVSSESQTSLGTVSQTVYKVVPAGKSIRFREANMGFVNSNWARYGCEIVDATAYEGGA